MLFLLKRFTLKVILPAKSSILIAIELYKRYTPHLISTSNQSKLSFSLQEFPNLISFISIWAQTLQGLFSMLTLCHRDQTSTVMQKKLCEILHYAVRYVFEFALQSLKDMGKGRILDNFFCSLIHKLLEVDKIVNLSALIWTQTNYLSHAIIVYKKCLNTQIGNFALISSTWSFTGRGMDSSTWNIMMPKITYLPSLQP